MTKRSEDPAFVGTATDRQWWNETGHCGGCGDATCHAGVGCTPGWEDGGCRYCPDRQGANTLDPPVKKEHTELPGQQDILELLS